MRRYQKLILDELPTITLKGRYGTGYRPLANKIGVSSTALNDWATNTKIPNINGLEKLSIYFKVPLPTLLMETGKGKSPDDEIIDALYRLTRAQKKQVADFVKALCKDGNK